jgi:hypothetical protein
MSDYKTCTKCNQSKSLDAFSAHRGSKSSKSGFRSTCKSCDVIANRLYRAANREKVNAAKRAWAGKNKDKIKIWDKRYQLANAEKLSIYNANYRKINAEKLSEQKRQWRIKNADYKKEADRVWSQKNKDKVAAASRRFRINSPEKAKAAQYRYQAKKPEVRKLILMRRRARMAESSIFIIPVKNIRRMMMRPCAYCGQFSKHLDHVIPIAKNGIHGLGNLIQSCAKCNQSKNKLTVSEWKLRKKKYGY